MSLAYLLPVMLSFPLLAAHFLRHGLHELMVAALAAPLLLLIRRWWAARLVQLLLLLAAGRWLWMLMRMVDAREAAGLPWARLTLIL